MRLPLINNDEYNILTGEVENLVILKAEGWMYTKVDYMRKAGLSKQ